MKMEQNTSQTSTALLRNANGVDTPKTESLCCAAAGIIASSSATAEALIPHEKLRGAALADATLNAQERPPAQPVVGCTHSSNIVNAASVAQGDQDNGWTSAEQNGCENCAMELSTCDCIEPKPVHWTVSPSAGSRS